MPVNRWNLNIVLSWAVIWFQLVIVGIKNKASDWSIWFTILKLTNHKAGSQNDPQSPFLSGSFYFVLFCFYSGSQCVVVLRHIKSDRIIRHCSDDSKKKRESNYISSRFPSCYYAQHLVVGTNFHPRWTK